MKHTLTAYLDQVISEIPDAKEAQLTRLELEDHILTKTEIMCLGGTSEQEALFKVLKEMGSPEELAESLGLVHQRKYPINYHILYYADSNSGFFSPERACKQLAENLAQELNCPYHNVADNPTLNSLDILIIIGLAHHKNTVKHLYEYTKKLNKKTVKRAILITSPIRTFVTVDTLKQKNCRWHVQQWVYLSDSSISQVPLIKLLNGHEIEVIGELYALRHFWLPGTILPKEQKRVQKSLERILQNCTGMFMIKA